MVSQKHKKVDTFIHRNRTRGVYSIFGEVKFRSRSAFCGCFGWAVLTTHAKPFSLCTASVPPSWPLSPLPHSCEGFTGLLNHLNNQQTNSIQFSKTTGCGLIMVFEVTVSSEEGCLNTLRLFSLGGELTLIFFLFLAEGIPTKPKTIFIVLKGMNMFTPI